jgi:hypothetical protein
MCNLKYRFSNISNSLHIKAGLTAIMARISSKVREKALPISDLFLANSIACTHRIIKIMLKKSTATSISTFIRMNLAPVAHGDPRANATRTIILANHSPMSTMLTTNS